MKNRFCKTTLSRVITALGLTPFLFGASLAGAQQEGMLIEEIIVTAQKRPENMQDIGMTISAFNAEGLAKAGITDVTRLSFLVAGLTYADAGNDAKFNLRGANSTNTFGDNPSIVGTYVDGVYKSKASQQTRAFFDVERLELLRGPQGTLYGRNTFAGALNLYTNKPSMEEISGSISASYEDYDTFRTEGFFNLPVSDTFALRIAAFSENGDGYIDNNAGPNAGAPDDFGWRLSAAWDVSDDLEIILRYTDIEETGTTAGLFGYKLICRNTNAQGLTDAFGSVRDCQNPNRGTFAEPGGNDGDEYDISQDFVPNGDLSDENITLEINWDAGPVLVKAITSYTDFSNVIFSDFDFSATNANVGGFDEYVEATTLEIVVSSNNESAFQWTAGVYYSDEEFENYFWIYNPTRHDNDVRPVVVNDGVEYTVLNGTPLVSSEIDINGAFADSNYIETETTAAFFQGEFAVSDDLRLIAGVRYSEEDKEAHGGGSNFTADGPVTFIATETNGTFPKTRKGSFSFNENAAGANSVDQDYDNVDWKASIEYDLNDDTMIYATASTGFLSGALNNNGTFTEQQESEMVEAGFKSVLMDGSLLFNMAVYYTEYTELVAQLQTIVEGIALTTTRNGGEIDAFGIDLELQWRPTAELSLGLTAAYLDAEFGEFGQTSPYQLNRGVATVFESVDGKTPGWSPDLVLNFFAEYTVDLGANGTLTPAIYFHYSDEYDTSNLYSLDPNTLQDSFTKTDLRLTWRSVDEKYTVSAYVENLEDEAVLSRSNQNSQDNVQTGYLYPQNYGVSFKMNW